MQNSTAAAVDFRILSFGINLTMVAREIRSSTAAAVELLILSFDTNLKWEARTIQN